MKFQLFDSEHKFHPSACIYVVEISDDSGYLEQHYFWTQKSADKFYAENMNKVWPKYRICYGGETLWFN